jgi:hypothetical protein
MISGADGIYFGIINPARVILGANEYSQRNTARLTLSVADAYNREIIQGIGGRLMPGQSSIIQGLIFGGEE